MRRAAVVVAILWLRSVAAAADAATLEHVRTEWQNAYGAIIYTVLADATNTSSAPLQYVRVQVTLLDKNGAVVAQRSGYNMGAEILEQANGAAPSAAALARVTPIPPGGKDLVRLSFDKADIGKPFRDTRVRIVEAR